MNFPLNDDRLTQLLALRAACKAGFVCLTKDEWDEMEEFESLFLLKVEAEENRNQEDGIEKNNSTRKVRLIQGKC